MLFSFLQISQSETSVGSFPGSQPDEFNLSVWQKEKHDSDPNSKPHIVLRMKKKRYLLGEDLITRSISSPPCRATKIFSFKFRWFTSKHVS